MTVIVPNDLIRLNHMRVCTDDNIHFTICKYLRPFSLKIIRLFGILRPPVHKNNDEIAFSLRHFNIFCYFFIIEHMHHIGVLFGQPYAIRTIGIIGQRKPDAIPDKNLIGMIIRLLFRLDAKAFYMRLCKKAFGIINFALHSLLSHWYR